jgi:FkbM family methyltransferase
MPGAQPSGSHDRAQKLQFGKYQVKRCKYGWMLFSGPYIGKCFELYGQYSEDEVRIIRAFVKPGDIAIDVGANIGDLTLPMALCAGETGRIYAFESHSDTFNVLCANLALNELSNTKAINAFVADSDRVETASSVWGQYAFVSKTWQPPFVAIDSLQLERCAFIKIDVDGNELAVLKSARATIARTRPILYLENDEREKSPALFEYLLQDQYRIYWHPAPIFEPDNFYGNPVNHWAPRSINSLMVLCIPNERDTGGEIPLKQVTQTDDWWN